MEYVKINQETLFNPSSSKTITTTFLDEKTTQKDDALGKGQSLLDPLGKQSISDNKSMATTKMFTKPFLVYQGLWNVSDKSNTTLYYFSLLQFLQSIPSPAQGLLSIYAYFRSGFKVTLRLNSSPFHSGKIAMLYAPPDAGRVLASQTQVSGYPVVYADAGNSSVVSLLIPFVTYRDFLNTSRAVDHQNMGQIFLENFNPLRIGTGGPTSVGFTIWLEPMDVDLAIPTRIHQVTLQSEDLPLVPGDLGMPPVPESLRDLTRIIGASGSISSLPDLLQSVLGSSSKSDMLQDQKPVRERDNKTEASAYAGSTPSISNMGGRRTEHLSLVPEQTFVSQSFTSISGRDEQSVLKIAQVPTLLSMADWTFADGASALKFAIPVTPCISRTVLPTNTTAGYRDYSYSSYCSLPYSFWRGSINYRFTLAATQQHSGRLLATWIPGDSFVNTSIILPNPTVNQLSHYPSIVFDLSENREFNISIPYEATTPFMRVDHVDLVDNIPGQTLQDDSFNGMLYITVLSKLTGPGTVSDTVPINCFISAGPDIQFKGLTDKRKTPMGIPYITDAPAVTLQSMDVALESSRQGMSDDKANSVSVDKPLVVSDYDQGKNSDDYLPNLLSRYYPQLGYRFTVAGQSNRVFSVSQHPGLLVHISSSPPTTYEFSNLITHFSRLFAFWEGSINYFFLHNTTVNNPILATFTHTTDARDLVSTSYPKSPTVKALASVGGAFTDETVDLSVASRYSHISNLRINSSVEVTVPYRNVFRRAPVLNSTTAKDFFLPGQLQVLYSNPSPTDQSVSIQIFQSLGDDFRFQYLVPPPRFKLAPLGA